ncbi:MAG: hypothetical protein IBX39_06470 [Candidatus Methanoperedenaceae archaeon]|nr:hypothetical protein [Candidatus Methanoperedenaceae archaeon]
MARPENITIERHITAEELLKRIKSLEKDVKVEINECHKKAGSNMPMPEKENLNICNLSARVFPELAS